MQTSHSIFLCWTKWVFWFKKNKNKSEVKLVVDRVLWLCACVKLSECVQEAKSQRALTWELKGTHHNLTPFNSSILIGHVFFFKKKVDEKMHSVEVYAFGTTLRGLLSFDCIVVWRTYPALKTWVFLVFSFPPRCSFTLPDPLCP